MIRRVAASIAVLGLACVIAVPAVTRDTQAAWTDGEVARGAGLTAGTVSPPTALTCNAAIGSATLRWTPPAGGLARTGYRWAVTGGSTGSGTLAANVTSLQLTGGLLTLGTGTFSLYAVGPGGWESTPVRATVTVVLGLLWGCTVP
ncbi:hypothetical protein GCM10009775_14400 [Microbacterium aoyamense]|uniref:Fibronectin type-III domain-containing protein n=1 Tax=Microbacterium aoyamense TaxID=344166 RepID=A0ABN2PIZ6_9MICO|nr:hypothetical protein [Microbacterium aoyamense]